MCIYTCINLSLQASLLISRDWFLPANSWRMEEHSVIIISRKSPPYILCSDWEEEQRKERRRITLPPRRSSTRRRRWVLYLQGKKRPLLWDEYVLISDERISKSTCPTGHMQSARRKLSCFSLSLVLSFLSISGLCKLNWFPQISVLFTCKLTIFWWF